MMFIGVVGIIGVSNLKPAEQRYALTLFIRFLPGNSNKFYSCILTVA